jgi:hypothetical protein
VNPVHGVVYSRGVHVFDGSFPELRLRAVWDVRGGTVHSHACLRLVVDSRWLVHLGWLYYVSDSCACVDF